MNYILVGCPCIFFAWQSVMQFPPWIHLQTNCDLLSSGIFIAFGFELSFVHISTSKNMFSFQFQNKTPRLSIYIKIVFFSLPLRYKYMPRGRYTSISIAKLLLSLRCRWRKSCWGEDIDVRRYIYSALIFHVKNFNWLFNSINETLFGWEKMY